MPRLHVIQQLDSGFSIQIPTKFLEQIGVHGNDDVEICCREGMVMIHKASAENLKLKDSFSDRE